MIARTLPIFVALLVASCGGGDGGKDAEGPEDQAVSINPMVSCGTETCSSGNECCVVPNLTTKVATSMCVPTGGCDVDGGVPAMCDGPEDCASSICCLSLSFGSGSSTAMGQTACATSCPVSAVQTGNDYALGSHVCHTATDCTGLMGNVMLGSTQVPLAFDMCCTYAGIPFNLCAPQAVTSLGANVTCQQ